MAVVTNNVLVTPKVFAKLALFNLRSKNNICRNLTTEISQEFQNKAQKVGDTVTVRRPYRFQVTEGLEWSPQPLQDTVMPVKVDTPLGIHFQWDTVEKTLSLRDANENYAGPAAAAMSASVNSKAAKFCAQNTPNYAGTPGTLPTTVANFLEPGSRIIELGCPENEELHLIVNRAMSDAYINARSNYFNPQTDISSGIKTGRMVDQTLGYTIDRDQTLYTQTTGIITGTPVIDTTSLKLADGGDNATMTLVISGYSGTASDTMKQGDKFMIEDCYSVHPQTKASTGRLKCFTAVADGTEAANVMTVTVFPAITPVAQNPGEISQYANTDSATVTGKKVYIWAGTSGAPTTSSAKKSIQGLVMHKNAFAFVSVPLANPEAGRGDTVIVSEDRDPETGMWMSFIRAFDSRDRIWINRFDTLVGYGKLYAAELSCVLAG